jgi:hypothetical protein
MALVTRRDSKERPRDHPSIRLGMLFDSSIWLTYNTFLLLS